MLNKEKILQLTTRSGGTPNLPLGLCLSDSIIVPISHTNLTSKDPPFFYQLRLTETTVLWSSESISSDTDRERETNGRRWRWPITRRVCVAPWLWRRAWQSSPCALLGTFWVLPFTGTSWKAWLPSATPLLPALLAPATALPSLSSQSHLVMVHFFLSLLIVFWVDSFIIRSDWICCNFSFWFGRSWGFSFLRTKFVARKRTVIWCRSWSRIWNNCIGSELREKGSWKMADIAGIKALASWVYSVRHISFEY